MLASMNNAERSSRQGIKKARTELVDAPSRATQVFATLLLED